MADRSNKKSNIKWESTDFKDRRIIVTPRTDRHPIMIIQLCVQEVLPQVCMVAVHDFSGEEAVAKFMVDMCEYYIEQKRDFSRQDWYTLRSNMMREKKPAAERKRKSAALAPDPEALGNNTEIGQAFYFLKTFISLNRPAPESASKHFEVDSEAERFKPRQRDFRYVYL